MTSSRLNRVEVAITLAPRTPPTINKCLKSIREIGIENVIKIFCEPSEYRIRDRNIRIIKNKEKLGAFKNFDQVLRNCEKDFLFYVQDDYFLLPGVKEEIKRIIKEDKTFGYYNFILHFINRKEIKHKGWNKCFAGYSLSGACFLLRKSIIEKILNDKYYQHHLKTNPINLDARVGEVVKRLGYNGYIPEKSFVIHSGNSTINHYDPFLGKRIIGEVKTT